MQLLDKVQGYTYEGYERTVDAHVKNLHQKIEEDPKHPRYILTVYGLGYKFAEQDGQQPASFWYPAAWSRIVPGQPVVCQRIPKRLTLIASFS